MAMCILEMKEKRRGVSISDIARGRGVRRGRGGRGTSLEASNPGQVRGRGRGRGRPRGRGGGRGTDKLIFVAVNPVLN